MKIEELIDLVNFRAAAVGKVQKKTEFGDVIYEDTSVFTKEEIENSLRLSLTAFNAIPPATYFKFSDEENIAQLSDILVTYATYILLQRQALTEKGREYAIRDNGVQWTPPPLAVFIEDVCKDLWGRWHVQATELKQSASFYNDFIAEPEE